MHLSGLEQCCVWDLASFLCPSTIPHYMFWTHLWTRPLPHFCQTLPRFLIHPYKELFLVRDWSGPSIAEPVESSVTLELLCFLLYGKQLHDKILCIMRIVNVCVLFEPVSGVCEQEQVLFEHALPSCLGNLLCIDLWCILLTLWMYDGAYGAAVGWGTELLTGRSWVRFLMMSLEFFSRLSL